MGDPSTLNERQSRLISIYCDPQSEGYRHKTKALILAGYPKEEVSKYPGRYFKSTKVKQEIERQLANQGALALDKNLSTVDELRRFLRNVLHFDMMSLVVQDPETREFRVRDLNESPRVNTSLLDSIEFRNTEHGQNVKFKLPSKLGSVKLLAMLEHLLAGQKTPENKFGATLILNMGGQRVTIRADGTLEEPISERQVVKIIDAEGRKDGPTNPQS